MSDLDFIMLPGMSAESQLIRELRVRNIPYDRDEFGMIIAMIDGEISRVDIRHISDDKYRVVKMEPDRRFRVRFVSKWSGVERINGFDTYLEAYWFMSQVGGELIGAA